MFALSILIWDGDILWKKTGQQDKRRLILKSGVEVSATYYIVGATGKFYVESVCFLFFGDKKKFLKVVLTPACTSMPWLLHSFDLPSYGSESRKSYTLKLLLMYLGEGIGGWKMFYLAGGQVKSLRVDFAWGELR